MPVDFARNNILFQHAKKARETGLFAVLGQDGPASGVADLGLIKVTGADAATFLHSQITNEVKALKPGEGNLSARATRTGTLLRYFSLHALPSGGFLLILEHEGIASLQSDLEKFAISDDVVFEDVSAQYDLIAIQGPQAAVLVDAALGKPGAESWTDLSENAVREISNEPPAGSIAIVRSLTGDTGFLLAIPTAAAVLKAVLAKLASAAIPRGFIFLDGNDLADVLEMLRIEAGVVRMGVDAEPGKQVLPETGLEQQVVSYSKGCYLGQEVIARIRTYGSVPNVLRGLIFESTAFNANAAEASLQNWQALLDKLPPTGAELQLEDGKKAGTITSRSISPVLEAPVAYAYLDRALRTPGMKLKLKCADGSFVTARVALLPFYKASDLKARVNFLHDRAIRFFAENQDDKAVQMLEEALRLDPSFSDGYEALGVILGRTERFHEAIDIFKRLEEVAPNEPMVHTNLSLYYMKIGDKTKAEEEKAKATVKQFSRFGAMKKDEQQAAAEEAKKIADAQRKKGMFEEVLEIDAEDPIALFGLGNALSTLGAWDQAEKTLAKATSVQKDNSAVYLAHGKALEMLNREAEALEVYNAGMAVASRKGDLMPLKEMERRALLLQGARK
jgi:folate-binding protein YgfZ